MLSLCSAAAAMQTVVFSERGAGKHASRLQALNEAAVATSLSHRNVVSEHLPPMCVAAHKLFVAYHGRHTEAVQ